MMDATFAPYAGAGGYQHARGGGLLLPADYRGLAALLLHSPETERTGSARLKAALLELISGGNELVVNTLTCLEREHARDTSDQFPEAAGGPSGMPSVTPDLVSAIDGSNGRASGLADVYGGPTGPGGLHAVQPALLVPNRIVGALASVNEIDTAAGLLRNQLSEQSAGTLRRRSEPAEDIEMPYATTGNPSSAPENAVHTTLYHKGKGGYLQKPTACSRDHFRKLRLGGANDRFPNAVEFLWYHFQEMNKRSMHQQGPRLLVGAVADTMTNAVMQRQSVALQEAHATMSTANPGLKPHVTLEESVTGGVSKNVVGGKAYWREVCNKALYVITLSIADLCLRCCGFFLKAFVELMAVACEHGVPQFFATFTANEMGWDDLRRACSPESFKNRPVQATRQYQHRWKLFKDGYLKGKTPIGEIIHTWSRQEDQARGSLHVHMAIWVRAGTENADAIAGEAPRFSPGAKSECLAWRSFIRIVQRHECRGKCYDVAGDPCESCKYGYPRRFPVPKTELNVETDRYEYRCTEEEDSRLSPYVPLWSLAWGAAMNIQRCTGPAFLSYIAKYVTKIEPYGSSTQPSGLSERDGQCPQLRFLQARSVGLPESVFRVFDYKMKSGMATVHLITKPPDKRRRSVKSANRSRRDEAARDTPDERIEFHDGILEQYMKRPVGLKPKEAGSPIMVDFESMLYPPFVREFMRVRGNKVSKEVRESGAFWRCHGQFDDGSDDDDKIYYTVRRSKPMPVSYDFLLPDRHGILYYYQRLLLGTSFRSSTPSDFITDDENVTRSLVEECTVRGLLLNGSVEEQVAQDAKDRLFGPEAIAGMVQHIGDYQAIMDVMGNATGADYGESMKNLEEQCPLSKETRRLIQEDMDRLHSTMPQPAQALPPGPALDKTTGADGIEVWTWKNCPDTEGGGVKSITLKQGQIRAFNLLKDAGKIQILSFLSGEGGYGKSTVINLLVQHWRSLGLTVIVTASSAQAAKLLNGVTVHSAFKLNPFSGYFMRSTMADRAYSSHFMWLFKCDIIIVDEIGMLTSSALSGMNEATTFVKSMGASHFLSSRQFGGCSVIGVGDLYQLPAVMSVHHEQQVYKSPLWPAFRYIELAQNCRSDKDQALASIQYKLRGEPELMTEEDWALLETRVCKNHCCVADLVDFEDIPVDTSSSTEAAPDKSASAQVVPNCLSIESASDNIMATQLVSHCPYTDWTIVLAARRAKCDSIILAWAEDKIANGTSVIWVKAVDRCCQNGAAVKNPAILQTMDSSLRGQRAAIPIFVGMKGVLTINKRSGFVNGCVVEIIEIVYRNEEVVCIKVKEPDTLESGVVVAGNRHNVTRMTSNPVNTRIGKVERSMFPFIPAICVTVHRVQGITHEHDLHVLLNAGKSKNRKHFFLVYTLNTPCFLLVIPQSSLMMARATSPLREYGHSISYTCGAWTGTLSRSIQTSAKSTESSITLRGFLLRISSCLIVTSCRGTRVTSFQQLLQRTVPLRKMVRLVVAQLLVLGLEP